MSLRAAALELHKVHGILPVPASGKIPMGGTGWNLLDIATRLLYFDTPACTGLGLQFGQVFHPYYGPCQFRCIDVDEKDPTRRDDFQSMLLHLLGTDGPKVRWRWGRGPAAFVFTHGQHVRERYGSVQFLGPGKYAVGWGAHPDIAQGYRWPDGDIFQVMPPLLEVKRVEACLLTACAHAGIVVQAETADIKLVPAITEQQLNALTDSDLERYQNELAATLDQIRSMLPGTGRGTALYELGLRYGALAKHDVRFAAIVNAAIATLPGHRGAGDIRDFTRGIDESKGLAQQRQAETNQQRQAVVEALKPKGANAPGQELGDLLQENIPPLRWLIERYLPHVGTLALVGKPKIGKSFIVLEMALAIAEGGIFWGEKCNQTGVLLYLLEDGKRRVKERVRKLRPNGIRPKQTFRIRYGRDGPFRVNPDGTGGLLDDIRKHKHDFADIGFVVIDMWKMVRGNAERGLDAYQATSQLVAPLSALAQELDITILLVHHARKGKIEADDVSDAASGSNALQGATEGSWTIWREGEGARIVAEVRESESFDMQLVKGEGQLVWNPIELETNPSGRKDNKVRIYIEVRNANCELMPADIAMRLKLDERIAAARLSDLRKDGKLAQRRHGHYGIQGCRVRHEGIAAALMQMAGIVKPVTTELRALHDPEGRYSRLPGEVDATGFGFAEDIINAIEQCGFANGKTAVRTMDVHKLLCEHKGVVWFFGAMWNVNRTEQPLPWTKKFPWEV